MPGTSMTTERTLTMIDQVYRGTPSVVLVENVTSLSLSPSLPSPLFVSDVFGPKQQYIAFLLENSGMQVGSYVVCSHIIRTLV